MSVPRALIAEDEPVLRGELRHSLVTLWPELTICGEAGDGVEAIRLLETQAPDVLFLDIQMPGISGLDVARLASGRCHVVFVTAYDQYAVDAFEQGAVDYVMKPFTPARLASAVERVKGRLRSIPANLDGILSVLADKLGARRDYLRWITASHGAKLRLITVDEICYFQADTKYTRVVTADSEALIRRPIKDLHAEVDPAVFWQIHRATLLNVTAIAAIERDYRGRLRIQLKRRPEMLSVSEPYIHLFRQM